jgi:hypothetical protein
VLEVVDLVVLQQIIQQLKQLQVDLAQMLLSTFGSAPQPFYPQDFLLQDHLK